MSSPLVSLARVSGDDSQQIFDTLLRSVAEPGSVVSLPEPLAAVEVPPPLWLPLALADVDTPVSVSGAESGALGQLVHEATNAPIVEVERSWIAVALDEPHIVIDQAPIGTALAPEDGARVALAAAALHPGGTGGSTVLTLAGPGVPGRVRLGVDGIDASVLGRLGRTGDRFPAGFDTWLFADDGRVAAIPRSTSVSIEAA